MHHSRHGVARRLTHALTLASTTLVVAGCSPAPPCAGLDAGLGTFVPAPHAGGPQVTLRGGRTLAPLRVVTVTAAGDPLTDDLVRFGAGVPASCWWHTIGADYHLGEARPSASAVGPAITHDLTSAEAQAYLDALILGRAAPASDADTLYVLYLPPGINWIDDTGVTNFDCHLFSGLHLPRTAGPGAWALVQRCDDGNLERIEAATITASHEIAEAATDPDGLTGWGVDATPGRPPWSVSPWSYAFEPSENEVGDLCAWTRTVEGGFSYQRIWSTHAAAAGGDPCVPAGDSPFYNVSGPDQWVALAPGTSTVVQVTGWSSAPADDWSIDVYTAPLSGSTDPWVFSAFSAEFSLPGAPPDAGFGVATMNDGRTVSLRLTASRDAPSGVAALATVLSFNGGSSPGGGPPPTWVVGVYVP